jgi:hypothetical protein
MLILEFYMQQVIYIFLFGTRARDVEWFITVGVSQRYTYLLLLSETKSRYYECSNMTYQFHKYVTVRLI